MTEFKQVDRLVKIGEIERELKKRRQVYPHMIAKKQLSKDKANYHFHILRCILEDYVGNQGDKSKPRTQWDCPMCGGKNIAAAGVELVHCGHNEHCGQGPFYLQQCKEDRRLVGTVVYHARKIEGVDYKAVQHHQQSPLL